MGTARPPLGPNHVSQRVTPPVGAADVGPTTVERTIDGRTERLPAEPGQIMTAVAKVRRARAADREIDDAELDEIRNVCRCGTYSRIRDAIKEGARRM
jgi:hypothetical protein